MATLLKHLASDIEKIPEFRLYGRVTAVLGMMVEIGGVERALSIGDRCFVQARGGRMVACEVVGFRDGRALAMPFGPLEGVGIGSRAQISDAAPVIYPDESWLGRVVDAMGRSIDGAGPLAEGAEGYPLRNSPPPAHRRQRVGAKLDVGVRAINQFISICRGQRMGIFAGSGVGKSVLMAMLARFSEADVFVIGLIGERGREVQEFIQDYLGEEGMRRSVVVVATSDESPLMRRQAAYLTLAVAEYFRDQGKQVLCMMDSVTRFAMAQREIGLATGEPPASKGYTPTVFAELPRLLERAGPGVEAGAITGLFSVLVEGDDHNEPISDAVRGILDGHVVLERAIADRGRYPAINILRSVSRMMPDCNTGEQTALIRRARALMSTYEDMADMIRLGAYRRGSDPLVDEAIRFHEPLEAFLNQDKDDNADIDAGYAELAEILGVAMSEAE
ncbi:MULTISPECIES: flagellar protein export ATPase FliI [Thalassobaculum]|uniref:Flagellum-specific ATP synthase n=1 Tax=Thalassobaculum litoreum DSM 18839 TaxID=1123362 RepID=A0A8G2BJ43_9PROT|nr:MULTISPECIES: flagellar protein export ATPase FliI [Thalassobaculum]SDG00912.1 flagellum-specific ATP synthase [Thalassobaculum litoreum DSM 18839]